VNEEINMLYAIDAEVIYNDLPAVVLAYAKGWYTVQDEDGASHKCRGKELSPAEGDEDERTMKGQLKKARAKYVPITNYSGERSMDCGDPLAQLMRGLEPHEVCLLADTVLGEEAGHHSTRYGHLNAGQQRMNSGNRIRGALKKETITTDDVSAAYDKLGLVARGQETT
jgi:hypothetical protein